MAGGSSSPLKTFARGGLVLLAPSPADASAEAHAHETDQVYFGRGGIELRQGDVVLDLGANVGSFSRMAAPLVGATGTIYAVEPLPLVYEALQENAGRYALWAERKGIKVGRIVPVHAGCGALDGPPVRAFTYYPRCTAFSSMHRDDADAASATLSLLINRKETFSTVEAVAKLFARYMPVLYRAIHVFAFTQALLRPAEEVECPMTTVSDIIEERGISEVGLLKANVERAEWDVLQGVRDEHWQRIRQVSLQVHDIDGRVSAVEGLLRAKGFRQVTVWQEPRFAACNLHMVYALQ